MRHATPHSSTILRLAGPLIVSNLATAGMMTADTLMSGQLGAQALAAVAVGSNYVGLFQLGGLGMLMAMSPTVAHAYGSGRDAAVGTFFRQALWLALAIALVVIVALAAVHPVLRAIGTPPDVAALAAKYVYAVAFGMPGYFAFLALRFSSEGLGWTRPILYVAVFALSANVFLNWVFMFGNLGAPALGAVGAGVATASVHWLMLGFMWQYVNRHRRYRGYAPLRRFEWPDRARLREILVLGVPICGSVLAEGGLFSAAALILGTFGATIVAAHAVALNYAALMFMVPLSLHSATTIHVGHLAGAGGAPRRGARAGSASGCASASWRCRRWCWSRHARRSQGCIRPMLKWRRSRRPCCCLPPCSRSPTDCRSARPAHCAASRTPRCPWS
jgi:multidrug resistance protein, MATE family